MDTRDRPAPQITYVPQENLEVMKHTAILHPSTEVTASYMITRLKLFFATGLFWELRWVPILTAALAENSLSKRLNTTLLIEQGIPGHRKRIQMRNFPIWDFEYVGLFSFLPDFPKLVSLTLAWWGDLVPALEVVLPDAFVS